MLFPTVRRHVLLSVHSLLTDFLFVAGLGYLAAARAAFLKQLRKEVAIPVFVKDQFALGWCGVCLCVLYLEKSGSGPVDVARMELEWDVDFDVVNNLRLRLARNNR